MRPPTAALAWCAVLFPPSAAAALLNRGSGDWHGLILGGRALDCASRMGLGFRPNPEHHILDTLSIRIPRCEDETRVRKDLDGAGCFEPGGTDRELLRYSGAEPLELPLRPACCSGRAKPGACGTLGTIRSGPSVALSGDVPVTERLAVFRTRRAPNWAGWVKGSATTGLKGSAAARDSSAANTASSPSYHI